MYALLCKQTGTVYVGMVGKDGPRAPIERYPEHERGGRLYHLSSGANQHATMKPIYRMTNMTGSHEWILIPLQLCTAKNVWYHEKRWMRRMGNVFNHQQLVWKTRQWQLLGGRLRQFRGDRPKDILSTANRIITSVRCPLGTEKLLNTLISAKNIIKPDVYDKFFIKIHTIVRLRTKITIPAHISVSYRASNHVALQKL